MQWHGQHENVRQRKRLDELPGSRDMGRSHERGQLSGAQQLAASHHADPNFLYALPMIQGKMSGTPAATGKGAASQSRRANGL